MMGRHSLHDVNVLHKPPSFPGSEFIYVSDSQTRWSPSSLLDSDLVFFSPCCFSHLVVGPDGDFELMFVFLTLLSVLMETLS